MCARDHFHVRDSDFEHCVTNFVVRTICVSLWVFKLCSTSQYFRSELLAMPPFKRLKCHFPFPSMTHTYLSSLNLFLIRPLIIFLITQFSILSNRLCILPSIGKQRVLLGNICVFQQRLSRVLITHAAQWNGLIDMRLIRLTFHKWCYERDLRSSRIPRSS
jgi:hypothetical protein